MLAVFTSQDYQKTLSNSGRALVSSDAADTLKEIEYKVAEDSVAQYNIAKRNGTAMDVCVQAGLVSAAYLQAQNEVQYKRWKETEERDCAAAGLSR